MKKLFTFYILLISAGAFCQQGGISINANGTPPDPSAALDINYNNKGALMPRLTSAQRDSIQNPADALLIFNTTTGCFNFYKNSGWFEWCGNCIPPATPVAANNGPLCPGSTLTLSASAIANVSYNWTGPGSFTSSAQNPVVSANATTAMGGTYTVVAVLPDGCTSLPASTVVVIDSAPPAPVAGVQIATQNQITWNWDSVPGATGYKWNTSNDYGSATDNGTSTTYMQTGLSCGTTDTLYVWAYNASCGGSLSATVLTQATSSCCTGTIVLDNAVAGVQNASTFSITTSGPNEVVLIVIDGFGHAVFGGSVSVSGGNASAVTQVISTTAIWSSYGYYLNSEVYGFIAATAATYNISVTSTPGDDDNYSNSAIALTGFCNVATIANNVATPAPTWTNYANPNSLLSTLSTSIAPTVANSYIIGNYTSAGNPGNGDAGTLTWLSPAGTAALESNVNSQNGTTQWGIVGYPDTGTGSVTFTAQDLYNSSGNIWIGNIQCVDVHN